MKKLIFPLLCFLLITSVSAQISLDNASFEGEPEDATLPNGWLQCKQGTTPDILPGAWAVYTEPSDGETYMGLITRSDKTWESVGQRLSQPIKADQCYSLSVDLAHSNTYTGYNKSVKLRIWAGKTRCSRGQLLWESKAIDHTNWETYEFFFQPKATFHYIIIEAYFPNGYPIPHKGNILIDNISDIEICERA